MQPDAFVDSRLFNFTAYISLREQQHIRRLSLFKRQKSSVPNTGTLQFLSYFKNVEHKMCMCGTDGQKTCN